MGAKGSDTSADDDAICFSFNQLRVLVDLVREVPHTIGSSEMLAYEGS